MRTIRQIAAGVAEDFAARNVGATVVWGNWQADQHAGADRVVIGLGDFDLASSGVSPVDRPGTLVRTGASTAAVAENIHAQSMVIWVHGVAPVGTNTTDIPDASHDRTSDLLHATVAALIRVVGRGSLAFGKGTWPSVGQGDVSYGALAKFTAVVDVPVYGDAWAVVPKPYSADTTVKAELPSGTVTVATSTVTET